jgi:hypothetical protein
LKVNATLKLVLLAFVVNPALMSACSQGFPI